jgi:hemerythrin-like domain-containing protein
MCDYCGCRDQWPIEELGREHDRLTTMGRQVRAHIAANDTVGARRMFDVLVDLLDAHSAKEEEGLFAVLRAEGELVDDVAALIADHDAIAGVIIRDDADPSDFATKVDDVLSHLVEHIDREENDLYPATRLAVTPAGWARVEAVHQAAHQP